jgi:hypothetical protein
MMWKSIFIVYILILTIIPIFTLNCSSQASLSPSQVSALENELYKTIQFEPKIEGVIYLYKSANVVGAEFTLDKTKYQIAYPYSMNNISDYALEITTDDGKFKFMGADYGSEESPSRYVGSLDGKVDYGELQTGRDIQIFNRYNKNNLNLRDSFQNLFNTSLENALVFFKQR